MNAINLEMLFDCRILWFMVIALLCCDEVSAKGNQEIASFSAAKRHMRVIYVDNQQTFYCECQYKGRSVLFDSCGFKSLKNGIRSKRIEWEHIVPASRFGRKFKAWKEGHKKCGKLRGRKCLRKVSAKFRKMEADLYNLVPAIGEINQARSNYRFGIIKNEFRFYGSCDFEKSGRIVEPRSDIRGDIARVYFYMSASYPGYIVLSPEEIKLFNKWNQDDPPDKWERLRARRIHEIQGNRNYYITNCR